MFTLKKKKSPRNRERLRLLAKLCPHLLQLQEGAICFPESPCPNFPLGWDL